MKMFFRPYRMTMMSFSFKVLYFCYSRFCYYLMTYMWFVRLYYKTICVSNLCFSCLKNMPYPLFFINRRPHIWTGIIATLRIGQNDSLNYICLTRQFLVGIHSIIWHYSIYIYWFWGNGCFIKFSIFLFDTFSYIKFKKETVLCWIGWESRQSSFKTLEL